MTAARRLDSSNPKTVPIMLKSVIEAGIPTLYHYQKYNPEHLSDMLERKRIHCSTPGQLNDPRDCRPWYDFSKIKEPKVRGQYLA